MNKNENFNAKEAAHASYLIGSELAANGYDREAIRHFEQARTHDADHPGVAWRVAVSLGREGRISRAEREFETALKEEPKNAQLVNDYGYFNYQRGEFAKAEELFRSSLELDPRFHRARTNLGLALAQQGEYEQSLSEFQLVVPRAEALANVAMIMAQRGQLDRARLMFEAALSEQPDLNRARQALVLLNEHGESNPDSLKPTPGPATGPLMEPTVLGGQ